MLSRIRLLFIIVLMFPNFAVANFELVETFDGEPDNNLFGYILDFGCEGWVEGGELHLNAKSDSDPNIIAGAHLISHFYLKGDFRVIIDYRVINASNPVLGYISAGLVLTSTSGQGCNLAWWRTHWSGQEYSFWYQEGPVLVTIPNNELSGTLEFQRIDGEIFGYVNGPSTSRTLLHHVDRSTEQIPFIIYCACSLSSDVQISVAFDNLHIIADGSSLDPVISNVIVSQRSDDSKLIDIHYDLVDADGDTCTVSVEVSNDGGANYTVPAVNFTGDVGAGITPSTGKHIIWDCKADLPGAIGTNYKIRVVADDGN